MVLWKARISLSAMVPGRYLGGLGEATEAACFLGDMGDAGVIGFLLGWITFLLLEGLGSLVPTGLLFA